MTHVVTEGCIRCKHMECVTMCPVNCFHEGENFLVIDPEVCIDCTACVAACPVEAIASDLAPGLEDWPEINRRYSAVWPTIARRGGVAERPRQAPPPQREAGSGDLKKV
jgi:ferredoxin